MNKLHPNSTKLEVFTGDLLMWDQVSAESCSAVTGLQLLTFPQ